MKQKILVLRQRGGGEKRLPPNKYWIFTGTPRGEDAQVYELKPYGGKREVDMSKEFVRWEYVENSANA